MKTKVVKKALGSLRFACWSMSLLIAAATAFAQSTETKSQNDIPDPKARYEYVAPQNIVEFMHALKEAGKRGFRLDKMTVVPGSSGYSSKAKAKGMMLAGLVKFDGETRYDYNFFFAEGEDDPEKTLNALSADSGWRFRDVISVYGAGDAGSLLIEDIFANRLRQFPTMGNIYVLERTLGGSGKKTNAPVYKLLKAGVGAGKNPTPKMQGLIEQSLTEGFAPLATYFSFEVKSLLSVDSFFGVVVEKTGEAAQAPPQQQPKAEYKFVRSNRSDGLRKELETFAPQGFRLSTLNFNSAILVRAAGSTTPVSYAWLESDEKTYANDLSATLAKNPVFASGGIGQIDSGDYIKNILIFENSPAASTEYQLVKMIPRIPKEFKKNPEEYLKTIEKPEIAFQKSIESGYAPRDIFYSDKDGLTILFERQKK